MKIPRAQARGIFVSLAILGAVATLLLASYAIPKIALRLTPKVMATALAKPPQTTRQFALRLNQALKLRSVPPEVQTRLPSVTNRSLIYRNGCHSNQKLAIPKLSCHFGDASADRSIWLIGDSHAAQWFLPLNLYATKHHYQLVSRTMSSCPFQLTAPVIKNMKTSFWQCAAHNRWLLEQIAIAKPDLVVVSGYSGIQSQNLAAASLGLENLASTKVHVLVLADTPKPKGNAAVCLSNNLVTVKKCYASTTAMNAGRVRRVVSAQARRLGLAWLDVRRWFCVDQECPPIVDGRIIYADNTHISTEAQHYFAGAVESALERVLQVR